MKPSLDALRSFSRGAAMSLLAAAFVPSFDPCAAGGASAPIRTPPVQTVVDASAKMKATSSPGRSSWL